MYKEKDPTAEFIASALVFIWLPLVGWAVTSHSQGPVFLALAITFYTFIFYFMGEHTGRVNAFRQGQARCDECRREIVEQIETEYTRRPRNPEGPHTVR